MAKKQTKTPEKLNLEESYSAWLKKHGYKKNKEKEAEFKIIFNVREKYEQARVNRINSCYWFRYTDESGGLGDSGGNWEERWSMQEKAWNKWYKPIDGDDFRSNVKSPMTTGRVESTLQKLNKLNYRWDAKPSSKKDRGKEKVASVLLDLWFSRTNTKRTMTTWFKDALVHGSAFARLTYQQEVRSLKFPMTAKDIADVKDKKKRAELKEKLEKGEAVWKDAEDTTVYDDLNIEPKPITSVYVDPQARTMHGTYYPARYVVERRIMTIEDFKDEFAHDPNASNVDKVKPTTWYDDAEYKFFKQPSDIQDVDAVEIFEYENVVDDEYVVIANDQLIKHSPLPYNHKQLSYHKIDCIEFFHQFYHIGIPDFLMNTQGTQEILMNLMVDYIYRGLNRKWFVAASAMGELTEAHMRADSQYIPVDDSDNQPITSKLVEMPQGQVGADSFRLFDILERDATLSTQIDPMQMSLVPGNVQATLGVINKEQMETMIAALIDNFANTGLLSLGRQIWALMQQKYTVPIVKTMMDDDGNSKLEQEYRTIRLDGIEIITEEDVIDIKETEDYDYSFFETKGEYINTEKEMDIRIAPDSLEVISRGLEMQKSREAYAQLMPNAVDPNNTELMRAMEQQGRIPLWDINKLASWYQEANIMPDIRIKSNYHEEAEEQEALEELKEILDGKYVAGVPGRSPLHVKIQSKALSNVIASITDLQKAMEEKLEKDMENVAIPSEEEMMMGAEPPQLPEPDPRSMDLMERLMKVQENLVKHIMTDTMPEDMFDEAAIGAAEMLTASMQPEPEMAPEGALPPGVPSSGEAPVPGGQIPMPQEPSGGAAAGLPMEPGIM